MPASKGLQMDDIVFIKELKIEMILGIMPHERETPQSVVIDVELFSDIRQSAETDSMQMAVDYAKVAGEIRSWCAAHQPYTVEALATQLAELCLARPMVSEVTLSVSKPNAISGTTSVGVKIHRIK
jgi:dihydroneopterin aldolase